VPKWTPWQKGGVAGLKAKLAFAVSSALCFMVLGAQAATVPPCNGRQAPDRVPFSTPAGIQRRVGVLKRTPG
jgi:hypothetical protein